MGLSWPAKDPDETLDYEVLWAKWLTSDNMADTIASSLFTFTNQAGLTLVRQSNTDTTSTVWLSGGTTGQQAVLNCRITTVGGRTKDQSITMTIADI